MIIAVDFDGVLCEESFPGVGAPNYAMISFVRELIDSGHEVILWTSRAGDRLQEAIDWCHDRGLHFCAVNTNSPSNVAQYSKDYPQGNVKVYADIYMDNHCPFFFEQEQNKKKGRVAYTALERLEINTRNMIKYLEKEAERKEKENEQ